MAPQPAKCMHGLTNDTETRCPCPIFVPRTVITGGNEGNLCDGCTHSISWHIKLNSPPPSQSLSTQIDAILSSYTMQPAGSSAGSSSAGPLQTSSAHIDVILASYTTQSASGSSSEKLAQLVSESEAQKEAISGLKGSYQSDQENITKVSFFSCKPRPR